MKQFSEQELLEKIVGINSVFPNEKAVAIELEDLLKSLGFKIERHNTSKNRWNILAERGKGKSSILFYGHMDTVPDYGDWKTDPLNLTSEGDKLYGLGACDMKGGIAAFLSAVSSLNSDQKIKILLSPDEENISEGAWRVAEERKEWFSDVDLVLVGEPGASENQIGGVNVITLGRRGRVVFEITVFGKSAHGAHPEKGVNAISEASKIALEIEKMKLPVDKNLGSASLFIRKITGESTSLSIPDNAVIEVDRHLVIPETIDSARKQIEDLISEMYSTGKLSKNADKKIVVKVKARTTSYSMPYVTDLSDAREIIDLIEKNFSKKAVINFGKSVADDNIFANVLGLSVVTIGPAGGNIHSSNEWISAKSLGEVTQLYKMIIDSKSKKSSD